MYDTIIPPLKKSLLEKELSQSEVIYQVKTINIYLLNYHPDSPIIYELSRLREETFRIIGGGTGTKCDTDEYDKYYQHIVAWDTANQELIGSYRICLGQEMLAKHGIVGMYTSSLFTFAPEFFSYFEQSLELGRTFIQHKYWKSRVLDYLWRAIAIIVEKNPQIRYLYGAPSISAKYPAMAQAMIVTYYRKWYGQKAKLVVANNPFVVGSQAQAQVNELLCHPDCEADYQALRTYLKSVGYKIPVLFKKYTGICEMTGTYFFDFCVDTAFSDMVLGLILIDLKQIKKSARKRYLHT